VIPEPQRAYLLELLSALGPAAEGLVLVGGHALRFMIARPRPTRDFDFVLDVAYLRDCSTSIASVLASLGYSAAENARNFQFEKPIPNSPEVMRIEFLAPAEFGLRDSIRVDVQHGVHGRACVGGSIVVVQMDEHEVEGSLPDGRPVRARIHVTRPRSRCARPRRGCDSRRRYRGGYERPAESRWVSKRLCRPIRPRYELEG
jgi:nucleotidyltransferase AbiEii toxin of type IV toxin-antitoxin system